MRSRRTPRGRSHTVVFRCASHDGSAPFAAASFAPLPPTSRPHFWAKVWALLVFSRVRRATRVAPGRRSASEHLPFFLFRMTRSLARPRDATRGAGYKSSRLLHHLLSSKPKYFSAYSLLIEHITATKNKPLLLSPPPVHLSPLMSFRVRQLHKERPVHKSGCLVLNF